MHAVRRMLSLHLYQAEALLSNSKKYNFSDKQKDGYLKRLEELFTAIKGSIEAGIEDIKIFEKKSHIDFIFKSLEFLKDSTLNTLPFEVVECLNKAMSDWIDYKKFIIVTSLQNNLYSFSYDLSYAKSDAFYQSLLSEYGISFDQKLVQINLPITLSRDYLSSVALYHELGHFVDLQHSITLALAHDIVTDNIANKEKISSYLPIEVHSQDDFRKLKSHLGEYFCDLFAAQYVGLSISLFLEYVTCRSEISNATHPSTILRGQIVSDFLGGRGNPVVDLLQDMVEKITNKPLQIRYKEIDSDDFYKLIPYEVRDDYELHGSIVYGWKVWLDDYQKFNQKMGYDVKLSEATIYRVINNLVEKTIGNYLTEQNWSSHKQ